MKRHCRLAHPQTVLSTLHPGQITGEQLFRRYRRAVGEKSWWGKRVRTLLGGRGSCKPCESLLR